MNAGGWTSYWQDRSGGGCVDANPAVARTLSAIWAAVARGLPPRARVLDLGTGGGAVLRELRRTRPDLKLEGIDESEPPAGGASGLKLRGGVRMEALPYPAARFATVVSQFGFEYADAERAAAELARVLVSGGACALVMHHRDGPVVRHNAGRADALRWALGPDGPIARGRAIAQARGVVRGLPPPAQLRALIDEAARAAPHQSAGQEIATATYQAFDPTLAGSPTDTLDRLEALARDEARRIAALLAAARDEAGAANDASLLVRAGVAVASPRPVHAPGDAAPFAWLLANRPVAA